MVEHKRPFRSYDTESDEFIEDLTNSRSAPYKFGRTAQNDYAPDHSVPLFLTDPDGEPDPQEFITPLRKSRAASVSSKILLAVVAAAGAATLFAWFSSDATRDIIVNAKASIASVASPPPAAAQPEASKLTASDMQLKDSARSGGAAAPAPAPVMVANASPSRVEISNAYQSALRGAAPAAVVPPAAVAPPPVVAAPQPSPPPARQISAQELAMLINRAKEMLSAGDIPSARLLLERATEAQDANAALMLARTYDPDVLGTSDVRNIIPEPAKARAWYEKAAQFGSAEAQRRLAQLPN
jgi:hypothetical protein